MKKLFYIPAIFLLVTGITLGQDNSPSEQNQKTANTKFILTGFGFGGMGIEGTGDEQKSTFGETGFSPIFLWKQSDRIFFESELEFELKEEGTEIGLEYANISYIFNKYMTLRAGKFLSPFGTFQERLHPAWINKLVSKPLGFGHSAVGPTSEIGFDLRGGIPLYHCKLNYSIYVSNGPKLNNGSDMPEETGMLKYENFIDNNLNKAIGGRFGLLPFPNSSVEIGASYQTAMVGDKDDSLYENIRAQMFAVDFSLVKGIKFLKGIIDIKGQFSQVNVDKADYFDPLDTTGMAYTFENITQVYYGQLSFRPAMLKNKLIKNIELVGRYATLMSPEESKWGEEEKQLTIGINYWTSWRTVIKFNYQMIRHGHDSEEENAFLIQFAIGF